jgi:hypothetical protein
MRSFFGLFLIAWTAAAQDMAPVGIVRGDLSLLLVRAGKGTLDVKTADGTVYQCNFDSQSLIERDNLPIAPALMRKGEQIEVLADRKRDQCYARIIRVLSGRALNSNHVASATASGQRNKWRFSTNAIDHLYPRGNLTFSGVIVRLNNSMLVLRTRTEPEKIVMLRDDTRYLDSGLPGEHSNLAVNTRVFIRCSKTIEDTLEAHQVIWGQIAGPRGRQSF